MDYFTPLPGLDRPVDFSSSTLLLPQPSLASLAQLGSELIVSNLHLDRIGFLGLKDHVPAVSGLDGLSGQDAHPQGISYSVEVFQTPSRSLTVVLPRSPVIKARRLHYLDSMKIFILQGQFREVLIVAGVDAALRNDEGLNSSSPLRHFLLPSSSPSHLPLQAVSTPYSSSAAPSTRTLPLMPHGGLTRKLLEALSGLEQSPPISALLIYTFETTDPSTAFFLADALSVVLREQLQGLEQGLDKLHLGAGETGEGVIGDGVGVQWRVPKSWEHGLMGSELPLDQRTELFG
ncbi:uncharacterized protein JCM6883_005679 [Sporobolomyces salmoneus]|uniref:uncharacterized protein n=1 Tax=Sporobolomyces salmoneus TaxID=183962 RepID=UPI00316D65BE